MRDAAHKTTRVTRAPYSRQQKEGRRDAATERELTGWSHAGSVVSSNPGARRHPPPRADTRHALTTGNSRLVTWTRPHRGTREGTIPPETPGTGQENAGDNIDTANTRERTRSHPPNSERTRSTIGAVNPASSLVPTVTIPSCSTKPGTCRSSTHTTRSPPDAHSRK